jgi:hypothetical protein
MASGSKSGIEASALEQQSLLTFINYQRFVDPTLHFFDLNAVS